MSSWLEFIKAGTKVTYDKAIQYICYYIGQNKEVIDEENNELLDKIHDYDLDIRRYTDENINSRIYPEVGLLTEYSYMISEPSHIIDNIYLGSAFNAASYSVLKRYDINIIFNMTGEITNYFPDDFTYHKYELNDDNKDSIYNHLETIYELIINYQNNNQGNIFIHCYMGRSRSASIVIYYIMKKLGYGFDDALDYILEKRPIVNPTFRFTKDLAKSINQ